MIKANTCPYCGGRYTVNSSCTGPRTANPDENTCAAMALHRRLVQVAAEQHEREGP